ncbi:unnamed protein product [Rotaria sp. Silwood1]|nr:unnamed protein product [Rotaria sp. Silwood1]
MNYSELLHAQLILLRLDIGDDDNPLNIYECLTSCSNPSSTSISNKNQYCCWTLRYLYVGLKYTSFLEHLIERLSVSFKKWMDLDFRSRSDIETLIKSNGNCFDPNIFTWPFIKSISIDLHPFLYLFFEQFNELFPNVSHIKKYYRNIGSFELRNSLRIPVEKGKCKVTDIQFRNVTRLDLGSCSICMINDSNTIELNKARAKVFAHLISMPVQLEYLLVEKVEWLFHIIQYVNIYLICNIPLTEFGIPSCYYGSNDSVHIGKNLVSFLSTYMPQLQILYLWRPDDFAWTSIRPDIRQGYFHNIDVSQWIESLKTSESIAQFVNVFQNDLC